MSNLTQREQRILGSALHCLQFNLEEHNEDNIDDISVLEIQRLQDKLFVNTKETPCLGSEAEKPS